MQSSRTIILSLRRSNGLMRSFSAAAERPLGFVGLGHMGSKMVENLSKDGRKVIVFDANSDAVARVVATSNAGNKSVSAGSLNDISQKCSVVFSMLPNDQIVESITNSLVDGNKAGGGKSSFTHISCSTISPSSARRLATVHSGAGHKLITAPVFARPDGIAKRQATWMLGGEESGRKMAASLLSSLGNIVDMGDDVGAANVVKLCGNFLIAASIESIGESMALAEKNGVDRERVMSILSSSIFDCLIYKGYGQRVSQRDHRPGGFSLALGLKDVSLVSQAARETDTPMPFLSVLLDRYVGAKAKGRADLDWSAIGLDISEAAGIDVSKELARNKKDVADGNTY